MKYLPNYFHKGQVGQKTSSLHTFCYRVKASKNQEQSMAVFVGDDDDDRSEWSQSYMVKRHYIIIMFRPMIMEVTKLQANLSTTAIFLCLVHAYCVP